MRLLSVYPRKSCASECSLPPIEAGFAVSSRDRLRKSLLNLRRHVGLIHMVAVVYYQPTRAIYD